MRVALFSEKLDVTCKYLKKGRRKGWKSLHSHNFSTGFEPMSSHTLSTESLLAHYHVAALSKNPLATAALTFIDLNSLKLSCSQAVLQIPLMICFVNNVDDLAANLT